MRKADTAGVKIGVDLMGNNNAPEKLLAVLQALQLPPSVELVAFGLAEFQKNSSFEYIVTPDFITMDEFPLAALRRKKKTSLSEGMRYLKTGHINGFISAGNTGALVSSAKMILGCVPGILRPALLARMPTKKNPVVVLDVGANIQVKASHLVQFALLGAAYCKARGTICPRVGLLNIGSEAIKGTSELRLAYQKLEKLQSKSFHFTGNIEGKSVFEGDVDVLITDGFTGNVFLKTAEGIANLILDRFKTFLPSDELQKLQPQIHDLNRHLHYAEYPGALLAGVQGVVIKCHGYAPPEAFANAIAEAISLSLGNFTLNIQEQLSRLRSE